MFFFTLKCAKMIQDVEISVNVEIKRYMELSVPYLLISTLTDTINELLL